MSNEKNILWQHLKRVTEIVLIENGKIKFGIEYGNKQYVPQKINTKIGIAVAVKGNDGKVTIGWSKRHEEKETMKFDSKLGYKIARERAENGHVKHKMPRRFVPYILKFAERSARYFRVKISDILVVGLDI